MRRREVAGIDTGVQVFAGGAVLGDGRVAMVVDVEKLGALVAQVTETRARSMSAASILTAG